MIAHRITYISLKCYEVPPLFTACYNDLGTQNGHSLNSTFPILFKWDPNDDQSIPSSFMQMVQTTPEHCGPPHGNTAEVIRVLCTITGTGRDKRIRPTAWISTYEDNAARLTCLYVCQVNAHSYSLHTSKSILMPSRHTHTHVHVHRWAHTDAVISESIAPSPDPSPSLERGIITYRHAAN